MTRRRRVKEWLPAVRALDTNSVGQRLALLLLTSFGLLAQSAAASAATPSPYTFEISAGPARSTLSALSAQTGLTIELATGADSILTDGVTGSYTATDALTRVLSGTRLTFAFIGPDHVEVHPATGEIRWYDISPGVLMDAVRVFSRTTGWDASVDRESAARSRTAGVRGCLTPDAAVQALLSGTSFTYQWVMSPEGSSAGRGRALIIHATPASRWSRIFRRERVVMVVPPSNGGRCLRICQQEGDEQPPQTCVHYPPAL